METFDRVVETVNCVVEVVDSIVETVNGAVVDLDAVSACVALLGSVAMSSWCPV